MLFLNQETECNELIKQILSFSLHITLTSSWLKSITIGSGRLRQLETERSSKDNKQVCGSLE